MSTVSGEQHEQDRISRQRHEQEGVDDNDHRHQHRERRSSITSITNNTAPPPTYHYSQGGVRYYDDDGMSYSGSEDRFSFSSNGSANSSTRRPGEKLPKTREKYSSSSFVQTTFFPIINMIVTVALIGVMIMVYIRANGQTIGTTQAGMAYPTVMALVVTILVTFISGGIGYAVSEYKWLRFQKQESQLSLMDVYDSCSRGIGGVLRVILFLKFDSVIIATIIFSLGLLAIPPAAQQVLHSHTPTPTQICEEDSYYYPLANSIESGEQTTYQYRSNDPRSIKGLMQHSEIQFYMKQYMLNVSVQASLSCAPDAINCTFPFLTTPHVTMECEPGSWDTQIVDVNANNLTTLGEYWKDPLADVLSDSTGYRPLYNSEFPHMYYAGSMYNRTYYDLNNITDFPYQASDNYTMDFLPEVRNQIGDQTFVLLTDRGGVVRRIGGDYPDIHPDEAEIRVCTLRAAMNLTNITLSYSGGDTHHQITSNVYGTYPVDMDYDGYLGNTTTWALEYTDTGHEYQWKYSVTNMYGLQQSIMRELILDNENIFKMGRNSNEGPMTLPVEEFFREIFLHIGLAMAITLPRGEMLLSYFFDPTVCRDTDPVYEIDPKSFYPLALSLIIPLGWWAALWSISLYRVDGVSRGHSQIALLVTGLTPEARDQLQGDESHADQFTIRDAAKQVVVRFGERDRSSGESSSSSNNITGDAIFGLPHEVKHLRTHRRNSI